MASSSLPQALQLAPTDNIAVALADLPAGASLEVGGFALQLIDAVKMGHKFALRSIGPGERILKYNCPIGLATTTILPGQYVHTHNVRSTYLANTQAVAAGA